jgi:hypothetical protein
MARITAAIRRHTCLPAEARSGADGIRPLAKSFGARPLRADAAVSAAVPSASAGPVPVVDPDDRSDDRHPERSVGPHARSRALPGSTRRRRELISELGTHVAGLVQQAGADQERPAAVTAATATTPQEITCPRRSPGPAVVTAKTPKNGLEITAVLVLVGGRAIGGSRVKWSELGRSGSTIGNDWPLAWHRRDLALSLCCSSIGLALPAFPAGASFENLAEHYVGGLAAGGLDRPYSGQGDPEENEQYHCCHPASKDQQHVGRQGHSEGDGDRAGGSFHEDENVGWRCWPAPTPDRRGRIAEEGR